MWDRRRILAYIAETYGDGPPPEGPSYRDMPPFVGGTCRIDGAGRVTAYGSVVDMETQDPTYVPAQ